MGETTKRNISYLVLMLLLFMRISVSALFFTRDVLSISGESDLLFDWAALFYVTLLLGGLPAVVVAIALNQDDLQKLNIDRLYVILLLLAGIIQLYQFPYNFLSGIAIFYLIYLLAMKKKIFHNTYRGDLKVNWWVLGAIYFICSVINLSNIENNIQVFIFEIVPFSIFEEAVYRGLLYMLLNSLKFSDTKILYVQAFIFWISHIEILLKNPFGFFVLIPIVSILLGYIIFRMRSLSYSSIAHIAVNFLFMSFNVLNQ